MQGAGHKGRLPPVVSSLFSIKAAHLKRWYQRHGAGSKGQGADGATVPRYRLLVLGCAGDTPAATGNHRVKGSASRGGGSGVEHEHEHEHKEEKL
jgi:hypothetical protein